MSQGRKSYNIEFKEVLESIQIKIEDKLKDLSDPVVLTDDEFKEFYLDYYQVSEQLLNILVQRGPGEFIEKQVQTLYFYCNSEIITVESTTLKLPKMYNYSIRNDDLLYTKYVLPKIATIVELRDNVETSCNSLKDLVDKHGIKSVWSWSDIPKILFEIYASKIYTSTQFKKWCINTPSPSKNMFPELEPIRNVLLFIRLNKKNENS